MSGPWEEFSPADSAESGPWSEFGDAAAKPSKQNKGLAGDLGTDVKRGIMAIPGAFTGMVDIPVAAVTGTAAIGEGWDRVGKLTGFQPSKWAKEAEAEYSPARKEANRLKDAAWEDGTAMDVAGAYLKNPGHNILGPIVESVPSMLAGGVAARGIGLATKLAPAIAGSIGEGGIMAGQQMNQLTAAGVDPRTAAGYSAATGIAGGALGAAGGKVAQKLGVIDPDTALAGGVARATSEASGLAALKETSKRMVGGGVSEGVFEELPQSVMEQGFSNLAQGNPVTEGMARAGVEGTLAGFGMGAAFNALPGSKYAESKRAPVEDKPDIAGLLPSPTMTGTPSDQTPQSEVERQNAVDSAQKSADQLYAERAAYEEEMAKLYPNGLPTLTTDPVPLQQRIDEMLGVNEQDLKGLRLAKHKRDMAAAFAEVVGITHDADGREIPLTMGALLDSQAMAEDAAKRRIAAENANVRSQQLADEEMQQQPDMAQPSIPVVGPLSAIANAAVQSGVTAQVQMQQAAAAGVKSKLIQTEESNARKPNELSSERSALGQQAADAEPSSFAASQASIDRGNEVSGNEVSTAQNNQPGRGVVQPSGSSGPVGEGSVQRREEDQLRETTRAGSGVAPTSNSVAAYAKRPGEVAQETRNGKETDLSGSVAEAANTAKASASPAAYLGQSQEVSNASQSSPLATQAQQTNDAPARTATVSAPASRQGQGAGVAGSAPAIDLSNRTDGQLKFLAQRGINGNKEAAIAEIARRATMSGANEQQAEAGLPDSTAGGSRSAPVVPAADLSGDKITKEWTAFSDDSGSLKIPRANMPQIKAEHRGAMTQFMNARGVTHTQEEVPADSLRPTQAEFSPAKVKKAIGYEGGDRSILVSADNYVLDGHHQWLAKRETGSQVSVIRLNAPIATLMDLAHEFPSSTVAKGSTVSTVNQNQIKNASPVSASVQAVSTVQNQAPIKKAGPQNRDDLVGAILRATGGKGIHPKMAQTIVGDKANAATKVRGLFTLRGQQDLDDLAELLRTEEGYNVRDGNHLSDLVREQASGNPVYSIERTERDAAENEAKKYREEIRSRATQMGIKTVARKFDDIERDVLEAETKQAQDEAAAERNAIQADQAVADLDDDQINLLLELAARESNGVEINEQWITNEQILDAFDGTETIEEHEDAQGAARAGEIANGEAGGNRSSRGEEARFGLAGQTNAQAAEQFAQQQAGESAEPTKEQADRERDAVPFSMQMQSQPKPQGRQTGLFTADGRVSVEAKPVEDAAPAWHTKLPTKGLPITDDQRKPSGYGRVPNALADEAYSAITQNQLMNGMPMYAYYLPAANGLNGIVRLMPDDQNAAKPWVLLNGEAIRPAGQTKEQVIAKLAGWLRSAPVLGDEKAEAKPTDQPKNPQNLSTSPEPVKETAKSERVEPAEDGKPANKAEAIGNVASLGKISPADKAIYGMAAEGKSAGEILKFIASASRNPFYRHLAKLLLKTGINPTITVGDGKGWKMNAGEGHKYAAAYNPETNTVALFRPASSERHMLHELMHAASLNALSGKGLAAMQMKALFAHVEKTGRAHGLFYDQKTKRGIYGMANIDEFIAEAFSNPKFQAMLKNVPAPQRSGSLSSAWNWFVRIIRGILGVSPNQENALAQALEIGVDVMRENMKASEADGDTRYANGSKQTDSDAFRKWFGKSAVVDANGDPLVVYHGTSDDFTVFGNKYAGRTWEMFSDSSEYSNRFASSRGGRLVPVYLSIRNPLDMRSLPAIRGDVRNKLIPLLEDAGVKFGNSFKMSDLPYERDLFQIVNMAGHKSGFADAVMAAGYDGIIMPDNHDGDYLDDGGIIATTYIALKPNQIKSAIGNNGDFDGSNPDIRYNVAEDGDIGKIVGDSGREYDQGQRQFFKNVGRDITPKTMIERTKEYLANDFWKKMAVGIVDQFRGLRDLNDNGQAYMLARLSKGTAGAFETLLHHGKLSIKDGAYDGDQSGGFIEKLGVPLNGELDDFLWYVAANRAEGLAKHERENLFTPEDIAAGKSLAAGETGFDYTIQTGPGKGKTTRSRAVMFADALRVFNEFQKNTLDIAEQSGLIDGAARKFWESEFYVPFYRVSEEDGEFIGAKMGQSLVRQQAFKKLKGGTDKLNSDLLSNTLLNWSHLIEASAKNRAAKASLVGAENVGAAQRVAGTMAEYAASNGAMLPPGTKKTVWFQEGGQKVEYLVTDPFVMTAITSLEYAGMRNAVMDVMTKFKHWLTIGVTASPAFKVRNLIRDSVQAIGTSDLSYNPIKNVVEGFKQSSRDKQEYVSALASGGLIRFGTMLEGSESSRVRQLIKSGVKDSTILDSEPKWRQFYDRYLEPGISAYNELGNRSEEINRAALYNQLIKQGKSHAEAALEARDLMDFSMQGAFPTIRFLTQVVPFMNARLEGLYKLGRSTKDNPRKLAVVTGAVAMASIALMLGYEDDDDWKRREDFDRDNFWWFKFGGVEFRIPKPFEVGAVATLAERSLEYMINDEMTGERFRKVTKDLVMNNLSMNPVPQAIKPIVDLYANKDSFTGRPIETMSMQRLDPTVRYNSNTSMVARGLSNITGGLASPVQYDHIARAYFGWLGAFAVGTADLATRGVSDGPSKPTPDYWKVATQGILKEQGSGNSRYLTMVYEQAAELEQAHATYRQMVKEGKIEEARTYAEDNADKLKRYRVVEQVKRTEAKFNENIRAIERGDLDPDEKKLRIERIQKMKETVAKRLAPGYTP
jgi:hypothetical protein